MNWTFRGHNGFGFASIKEEGAKLSPVNYLEIYGEWPSRDFYTEEEYRKLQSEGWEYEE